MEENIVRFLAANDHKHVKKFMNVKHIVRGLWHLTLATNEENSISSKINMLSP